MGPPCEPFHLKIAELHCNMLLCGSRHPYVSACNVDKNYLNGGKFR